MAFEMPRVSKPEDVGLSSQRLQRLRDAFQADIDKGIAPGAVGAGKRWEMVSRSAPFFRGTT